jgi:hypothetical protein
MPLEYGWEEGSMANKKTVEAHVLWQDADGKVFDQSFNVELVESAGSPDINAISGKVKAVAEASDPLSGAKVVGAFLIFPFPEAAPTVKKGSAEADSTARRHAVTVFNGAPGENGRPELVEIHVPDPKDAVLDSSGPRIRLDVEATDVQTYILAVKNQALTTYGESIDSFRSSFVRQRVVTKRSKQAA